MIISGMVQPLQLYRVTSRDSTSKRRRLGKIVGCRVSVALEADKLLSHTSVEEYSL